VLALVNEGARLLEGDPAPRFHIDVVYLTGYGFPLYRGGPMLYADMLGLFNVQRRCGASPAIQTPIPHLGNRRRWLRALRPEGKNFNGE